MTLSSLNKHLTFEAALQDVEIRFLLNLPDNELNNPERLLFWIQEAQWFYEDFYSDNYSHLPKLSFNEFTKKIFEHCPLFNGMNNNVDKIIESFRAYKSMIPVCGCILLNPAMTKLLLVQCYGGNSWTFPRGKLNESETFKDCAIREVYEEIGFDVSNYISNNEDDILQDNDGAITLFIIPNIPEDTKFTCQTRKEISDIKFHQFRSIPKDSFAVKQFIKPLMSWISKYQPKRRHSYDSLNNFDEKTESIAKRKSSNKIIHESVIFNKRNNDTFSGESKKKWSVNEMFAANAEITGRNYDYDGNPHEFGSNHPRYVDYNSSNSYRDRGYTNSSNEEYDFSQFAIQSRSFHDTVHANEITNDFTEKTTKSPIRLKPKKESDLLSKLKLNDKKNEVKIVKPITMKDILVKQQSCFPVTFHFNTIDIMKAYNNI